MKITVHIVSHSIQPEVFTDAAAAELVRSNAAPGTVTLTSHEIEIAGPTLEWESDDENDEHEADCIIGAYRLVGNGETYNLLVTSVSGQQLYQSMIAEGVGSLEEGKEIAGLNFAERVADAWGFSA
jgi:hypothetical protein